MEKEKEEEEEAEEEDEDAAPQGGEEGGSPAPARAALEAHTPWAGWTTRAVPEGCLLHVNASSMMLRGHGKHYYYGMLICTF